MSVIWFLLRRERRRGRQVPSIAAVFAFLALPAVLSGCATQSELTFVNRTTVPIAVVDGGSRSIVAACSNRSIQLHNTWGGDANTGLPVSEPLPANAYVLSAQPWHVQADGTLTATVVIAANYLGDKFDGMPVDLEAACNGVPPPPASPPP